MSFSALYLAAAFFLKFGVCFWIFFLNFFFVVWSYRYLKKKKSGEGKDCEKYKSSALWVMWSITGLVIKSVYNIWMEQEEMLYFLSKSKCSDME